jgi:hypothetical protein
VIKSAVFAGVSRDCLLVMVQAVMKVPKVAAALLAVGVLAIYSSAQQAAPTQLADNFALRPVAVEPSNPASPEKPPPHKFFDRQQLLDLYVHTGMRVADTIKTCRELSHGGMEDWIPTQQCGGIVAWQAGSIGLTLGVGWMFHKTGHHRLERITPWVGTGASAAGWTKSVLNLR